MVVTLSTASRPPLPPDESWTARKAARSSANGASAIAALRDRNRGDDMSFRRLSNERDAGSAAGGSTGPATTTSSLRLMRESIAPSLQ